MGADSPDRDEPYAGARVERREDPALLTGEARYTDDFDPPRAAHAAILRNRYGHARIRGIDTGAAEAHDGVIGVFTAEDVAASEAPGTLPTEIPPPSGGPFALNEGLRAPERPILAEGVARYTGEPVALVVAEDRYTAHDALDLIEVDYERLDAVTDPVEAVGGGAPQLHESAPDNVALDWEVGDPGAVADAFAAADRTVELDLHNQRLAPTAIEPRAALASYAPRAGELAVRMASQTPHHHRGLFADALGLPEHRVRVRVPAVGGGFGSKNKFYPGEVLAAWASVRLGRPVKWQATRTEALQADVQGRGRVTEAALAFDDDGTVRGLRAETHAHVGAYVSKDAPFILTGAFGTMLSGQYEIPAIHCRVVGAFTNAAPIDAYRGAGRPEAVFVVERLMDRAAAVLGIDPVAFRRRNFVPADAFPYRTPVGATYDSGDYEAALSRALDLVDYESVRERQAAAREDGRYLGVGVACLIERSGTPHSESGLLRVHPSGTVTAYCGTMDTGQGHRTTFAQIVADELGVPYEDVEVVEGDTDRIPEGTGSFGSRSTMMAGNALVESAGKVIETARSVAAHHLEADEADVAFEDGEFAVRGAPGRSIHIQEVARRVYAGRDLPEGVEPGLEATTFYETETTYPFGVHVAVVEVDPESGEVDLERYVAVDDCGVQINPTIVEGQVHGSVAQGIGQALYEEAAYDDSGTLLTGSLQDYAVPKATHLPDVETDSTVTPSPRNGLGAKGIGESGTIAAPAAVVNAVCDALEPFGVDHLDMPLSAETVWRAVTDK